MHTYEFTLILLGVGEATEEVAQALYAGCDDGTLVSRDGVTSIGFAREADSLLGAIRSAIGDVRKAGFATARIEIDPGVIEGAVLGHAAGGG